MIEYMFIIACNVIRRNELLYQKSQNSLRDSMV